MAMINNTTRAVKNIFENLLNSKNYKQNIDILMNYIRLHNDIELHKMGDVTIIDFTKHSGNIGTEDENPIVYVYMYFIGEYKSFLNENIYPIYIMERIRLNIGTDRHFYAEIKYNHDYPENSYEQMYEFSIYGFRDRWYMLLDLGYSRTYYYKINGSR